MHVTINNYLKRWGNNPQGESLLRLVWSDDQRELRFGTFEEFCGPLYLRTITTVKETLKYSWIEKRWILELWQPPEKVLSSELPESHKGSYEPVYVFQDASGEALPLNLRVVELICSAMMNQPPTKGDIKEGLANRLERRDRQETTDLEDGLDISSPLGSLLSTGEAIAYGTHKGGR